MLEKELKDILKNLGEEPYASKIAREIVRGRKNKPIKNVNELVKIVKKVMSPSYRYSHRHHFATSTFRAFRMATNKELDALQECLNQIPKVLNKNGRLVIISFHSLEDRIVKSFFLEESKDCLCPPSQPICTCEHRATFKILKIE